jgi:hypothetical protein
VQLDPLTTRAWRHGIAFIVAFDAAQLAVRTAMRASLATDPLPVFPLFRSIALSRPSLAALAIAGIVAAILFARSRHAVVLGLVALAANRVLLESFAALDGIYDETTYHAGAALLGWLCGRGYARAIAVPRDDGEVERMAALGAVAMFGATYLDALASKLLDGGLGWADPDTVRLMVLSHRPVGVSTWNGAFRDLVGHHGGVAMAVSIGTMVVQGGALFFPWTRRTRAVWGGLFVAFHVGTFLVSGSIFFPQAVFLALLFAVPWARVLARTSDEIVVTEPAPSPVLRRRTMQVVAMAVVAIAALCLLPIRPRAHPIERSRSSSTTNASPTTSTTAPSPPTQAIITRLGPLSIGDEIAGGFRVHAIAVEHETATVTLMRGKDELLFDLTARADAKVGPFDLGGLHVTYRETSLPFESFRAVGEAFARRLATAAGDDLPAKFAGWLREAR